MNRRQVYVGIAATGGTSLAASIAGIVAASFLAPVWVPLALLLVALIGFGLLPIYLR